MRSFDKFVLFSSLCVVGMGVLMYMYRTPQDTATDGLEVDSSTMSSTPAAIAAATGDATEATAAALAAEATAAALAAEATKQYQRDNWNAQQALWDQRRAEYAAATDSVQRLQAQITAAAVSVGDT